MFPYISFILIINKSNNMTTIEQSEPKTFDLKMPENYDFSTRKVNWNAYKPYYILRTDAVWEKTKLYQYFYTIYKSGRFFNNDKFHLMSDTYMYYRVYHDVNKDWDYSEIGESKKDTPVATPLSLNGELFQWEETASKQVVRRTSTFNWDQSKDMTPLCMLKFFKFMRCNERSEVKLGTITNNTAPELFMKYDCFREMYEMNEHCIRYHYRIMFEMYWLRNQTNYRKWHENVANQKASHVEFNRPSKSRVLYY